jgi:hypothetical protein
MPKTSSHGERSQLRPNRRTRSVGIGFAHLQEKGVALWMQHVDMVTRVQQLSLMSLATPGRNPQEKFLQGCMARAWFGEVGTKMCIEIEMWRPPKRRGLGAAPVAIKPTAADTRSLSRKGARTRPRVLVRAESHPNLESPQRYTVGRRVTSRMRFYELTAGSFFALTRLALTLHSRHPVNVSCLHMCNPNPCLFQDQGPKLTELGSLPQ